jgi:hypothetical protein
MTGGKWSMLHLLPASEAESHALIALDISSKC